MLRRLRNRFLQENTGAVMVEAMIGIIFILVASMAAIQLILIAHGAMVARTAATSVAHIYAITRDPEKARQMYEFEKGNAFGVIRWEEVTFGAREGMATATVRVYIPPVFPGAGLFGGEGLTGGFFWEESGAYPLSGGG